MQDAARPFQSGPQYVDQGRIHILGPSFFVDLSASGHRGRVPPMKAVPVSSQDLDALKKWLHEISNHVGVILTTAELLELEDLSQGAGTRRQTIEDKAVEVREILRAISARYFS